MQFARTQIEYLSFTFCIFKVKYLKLNFFNMKFNTLPIILVAAIMLIACAPKETTPELIPMKDFFKNPEKVNYRISPDGKRVAFKAPWKSRLNIFVQEIGSDTAVQVTFEEDRSIYDHWWASDNRILFIRDKGGNEDINLYGVDPNGENYQCFTCFDGVRTELIDELYDSPDEVIVGLNKNTPQVFDPYRLNIISGELTQLAQNPGNIDKWITDHDGKLRMAIAIVDGINQEILYRPTEKDEFKTIMSITWKEEFSPKLFTFDNKKVYAISNIGRDKSALVLFNPETGEEEEVLYQNDEVDVSGIGYLRKKQVLTFASYETDKPQFHFFDEEFENIYNEIKAKLPGFALNIFSENREETVFLIRTYSDRSRGGYYTYNKITKELNEIAQISPWLDIDQMAEMKPIKYTSRDGLTINGYLTLPVGVEAKNLPVVVNPHGGPWARDSWFFNPEVQFLANRGYAVLQMNYRGSTGYGKDFWLKSVKEWGRAMQDDISDGVLWLIDQGIADSTRIGIYGGSYGGYATLAGLTITPELYACGVDYVGVSNMFTFMNTIPPYWETFRQMLYELVGNPVTDSLMLAEVSPVFLVDNIDDPLLIAQGANDPRVNKNESDQMVEALKKRGIEVEYMVKDNEGHGFYNEENRFDFYRAMEQFFAKHLGGRAEIIADSTATE